MSSLVLWICSVRLFMLDWMLFLCVVFKDTLKSDLSSQSIWAETPEEIWPESHFRPPPHAVWIKFAKIAFPNVFLTSRFPKINLDMPKNDLAPSLNKAYLTCLPIPSLLPHLHRSNKGETGQDKKKFNKIKNADFKKSVWSVLDNLFLPLTSTLWAHSLNLLGAQRSWRK